MASIPFCTVDVFTLTRFKGNQLGIIFNALNLSTEQMQTIASEFNLSETTFILPPKDPANDCQVRIFTQKNELGFAGHPNVGTAFALRKRGEILGKSIVGKTELRFEEGAGLVLMELLKDGQCRLKSPQGLSMGEKVDSEVIAAALSMNVTDFDTSRHDPMFADCGTPFVLVQVPTLELLAKASPIPSVFAQYLPASKAVGIHIYYIDPEGGKDGSPHVHARMFCPEVGDPEDAATGSANVALVGIYAQLMAEDDMDVELCIEQGRQMGRVSRLNARARKRHGKVEETWISGHCVEVTRGTLVV